VVHGSIFSHRPMTDCSASPRAVITEFVDFVDLREKVQTHRKSTHSLGQPPSIYWAWCLW